MLGTAEMLVPVTHVQQPFRFVALPESDQYTLQAAFQSGLYRNTDEEEWIEDFRVAAMNWNPYSWKTRFRAILVAATLATLCLGSAAYVCCVRELPPHRGDGIPPSAAQSARADQRGQT